MIVTPRIVIWRRWLAWPLSSLLAALAVVVSLVALQAEPTMSTVAASVAIGAIVGGLSARCQWLTTAQASTTAVQVSTTSTIENLMRANRAIAGRVDAEHAMLEDLQTRCGALDSTSNLNTQSSREIAH